MPENKKKVIQKKLGKLGYGMNALKHHRVSCVLSIYYIYCTYQAVHNGLTPVLYLKQMAFNDV